MNRLKAWIRSYFGFSRTETNGFLILLPLIALLVFSEPFYRWWHFHYAENTPMNSSRIDSLVAQWKWKPAADSIPSRADSLFSFDPNKVTAKELDKLGFPEKVARRIINFRSRQGKFRIKSDVLKIYGMDSLLAKKIYAFIDLPEKSNPHRLPQTRNHFPTTHVKEGPFDLNQADTTQLIRIYGIGPKLSQRIIRYRTRLGGFISMAQLAEVYGLDTAIVDQLKKRSFIAEGFKPHQLNINKADKKELTVLPYIRFSLANSIVAYRFQHGDFTSVDELKQLELLDEPTFQKIKPYLTVKD